ncbi:MAG: FAD-dependent oxidoreductase, partial [Planctomycetota bacterium]
MDAAVPHREGLDADARADVDAPTARTERSRRAPDVTVLGGGVAGLVVARCASRRGLSVSLLERAPHLGGNATTFEHMGHLFDSGAHRLHAKDPEVTRTYRELLGDDVHEVTAPSRIHVGGRHVDFPLRPASLVRQLPLRTLVRGAFELATRRAPGGGDEGSFAELATSRYGPTLARTFLLDYSRKLWGLPCDRLSPRVAG